MNTIKLKKNINVISYLLTIMLLIYLNIVSGFMVLFKSWGGEIIYRYTDVTGSLVVAESKIIPLMILFAYIFLSSVYFISVGWNVLKNE